MEEYLERVIKFKKFFRIISHTSPEMYFQVKICKNSQRNTRFYNLNSVPQITRFLSTAQ